MVKTSSEAPGRTSGDSTHKGHTPGPGGSSRRRRRRAGAWVGTGISIPFGQGSLCRCGKRSNAPGLLDKHRMLAYFRQQRRSQYGGAHVSDMGVSARLQTEASSDRADLSITEYLTTLAGDGDALKYSGLLQLSDLSSDESDEFESIMAFHFHRGQARNPGQAHRAGRGQPGAGLQRGLQVMLGRRRRSRPRAGGQGAVGVRGPEDHTTPGEAGERRSIGTRSGPPPAPPSGGSQPWRRKGKLGSRDEESIRSALVGVIEDLDEELEVRRRAVEAVAGLPEPGVEEHNQGCVRERCA